MSVLDVQSISRQFAGTDRPAVDDVSLSVEEGELVTLLGPSGCGKTTTLRCIAGLENPDTGLIKVGDRIVFAKGAGDRSASVPPERRGLAMVFQHYALWPHLNVFENVAFGLKTQKLGKMEIRERAEAALKSVRLWDLRDRKISQLSGGQQQRIALARAVAPNPRLILFDEPLSNLDVKLRESMRSEIRELQARLGLTGVYVTHDQDEAFSLSSRVIVMNNGSIEQEGTPDEVWARPATPFVADFVGSSTKIDATVLGKEPDGGIVLSVGSGGQKLVSRDSVSDLAVGDQVVAYVKMSAVQVDDAASGARSVNSWIAAAPRTTFFGDYSLVETVAGDVKLTARTSRRLGPNVDKVRISIDPVDVAVYRVAEPARAAAAAA